MTNEIAPSRWRHRCMWEDKQASTNHRVMFPSRHKFRTTQGINKRHLIPVFPESLAIRDYDALVGRRNQQYCHPNPLILDCARRLYDKFPVDQHSDVPQHSINLLEFEYLQAEVSRNSEARKGLSMPLKFMPYHSRLSARLGSSYMKAVVQAKICISRSFAD
jgi:hypothetical protein